MTSVAPKNSNPSFEDTEFVQRLECAHLRLQLEQVLTLLPDHAIRYFSNQSEHFEDVILLLIEVLGLSELCRNHHTLTDGGTGQMTATLNAFAACTTEIIYYYGGDLLKFNGEELLACWPAEDDTNSALDNVTLCALYVRNALADFRTEAGTQLKLKFTASCGNVNFVIVGDTVKDYALHGAAVDDVKFGKSLCTWGEVVVSSKALRCLNTSSYHLSMVTGGFAKIYENLRRSETHFDDTSASLDELCRKYLDCRSKPEWQKGINRTIRDLDDFEHFRTTSSPRQSIIDTLNKVKVDDLKPFVVKLLQDHFDDSPNAIFVNEIRTLTIAHIDIVTGQCNQKQFKVLIENVYVMLQNFAEKYHGVLVWLSTFDRDVTATIAFGFKSVKNENQCRNALLAAHSILNQVSKVLGVRKLSIGISYGSVYCGLIGHPQRKNFILLGNAVNKAVSLTKNYPNKITCDCSTYKNSRLTSTYFRIIYGSAESIFEYNQSFDTTPIHHKSNVVARDEEYDLIYAIVNHPEKFNYYGICFYGSRMIGKSKLVQWCFTDMLKDGYPIVSADLCQCTQRPYFCLSNLYKQLYNRKSSAESDDYAFVQQLPSELWDFAEVLQKDDVTNADIIKQKFRIMSLFREVVKRNPFGFTVIFIDNIQYIDANSLDILETIISERCIRLICAGEFEKLYWDVRWRLSLNNHIKLLELRPLSERSISQFVCNYLHVKGVRKNLISMLENNCAGLPGVMEKFIYELSTKGYIEMVRTSINLNPEEYIIPPSNQKDVTLLVAQLKENYQLTNQITARVISMNTISQLRPLELSTLAVCVMLGEIFPRSSLVRLSNIPSEYSLFCAIKQLFYLGILECGYQCLMPRGLVTDKCRCYCPEEAPIKDKTLSKLPKIAFCKIFHFRDQTIKDIVYELIEETEKIRMHRSVIDHVQSELNMCYTCTRNNYLPVIKMPAFLEICNTRNNPVKQIGDYIHSDHTPSLKPKIFDITMCSCLELLLQTYSDLIEHCNRINCTDSQILYMIQHAMIVMLMKEYEQSISLLFSALHICKKGELSNNLRKRYVAKINMLIGKAFLYTENVDLAKQYLRTALSYFISIISDGRFRLKTDNYYSNDFVECLRLIIKYFAKIDDWKMAKWACDQCLCLIKNLNLNETYEIYATIIQVYCYNEEKKKCKMLIKSIQNQILNINIYSMQELFILTNLFKVIFHERLLNAKLNSAIRLGYRILSLTQSIHVFIIQVEVLVSLSWTLMAVKRIQDSVEIAGILREIGENSNDIVRLAYYTISIELILETSFMLEPYSNIHSFAMNYFKVRKRNHYTTFEKTFLLYLYNYHLRNNRWRDVCAWKNYLTFTEFRPKNVQSTKNLFKFTESLLIALVRNEVTQWRGKDGKCVEKYLEMCKSAAARFKLFLPRYYHFRSYFARMLDKKGKSKKYLNTAFKIAMQDGNVLEYCWLMQSRNSWDGGFSFEGDRKCVDWRVAKSYTPIHWSQILYGLPLYT